MPQKPSDDYSANSNPAYKNQKPSYKKPPVFDQDKGKKVIFNPDGGKLHQFGPLYFTEKQWKKFLRQLEQTISQEIRRQQARIKKAQEQLKRSIRGEPL